MADKAGSPPRAWQRMLSGRRLDLLDPSPLDVEITDIAHGLARVARWNGQTVGDHAFSVAQHCLVVEDIAGLLEPELTVCQRLVVLLHDAPEYVIGDMISPFKSVMGGDYKVVEKRLADAIHRRFGLEKHDTERLKKLAKKADLISAYFEAVELAGFTADEAKRIFGVPRGIGRQTPTGPVLGLDPLPTVSAEEAFLNRFQQLESQR
ncbi:YfbR-like 5'-deoxynucleotidase [Pleomorphomonas sp. NRK KF1]|uniref:YfbR-like 5'-deoxynucleotidase n=1 Tax=Pleomorphomonas sp. NRK KF1 TaxID=2943000 RepID=UPI0020440CA3|nr:HD family hydrolase [Pleomorphomonas sp. NRK KF1]MCM5552464.1 HD family hydrolase [Pleomorphomonas sp. NRK KF1]